MMIQSWKRLMMIEFIKSSMISSRQKDLEELLFFRKKNLSLAQVLFFWKIKVSRDLRCNLQLWPCLEHVFELLPRFGQIWQNLAKVCKTWFPDTMSKSDILINFDQILEIWWNLMKLKKVLKKTRGGVPD